jgi:hypothetical protein
VISPSVRLMEVGGESGSSGLVCVKVPNDYQHLLFITRYMGVIQLGIQHILTPNTMKTGGLIYQSL